MIDKILSELSKNTFDFRNFVNPADPLSGLFEEWIPYYRLKFSITTVLQPKSILEIGVRYGYSARTLLEASPSATFLGIDLDSERFGGQPGALSWARQITAEYDADYLIADSQKMERFPGGIYDLIHVDGQQDGIGTFHDLRRAIAQGRWILLDGYFWTRPNFLNANDFLLKFKDAIRYAVIIPGYAGELLIRVSENYLASAKTDFSFEARASGSVRNFYDSHYYLDDCGGYQTFRESGGRHVRDVRLLSLLALSELAPAGPAIDLGCGRGEITYQLASSGREVTAVDYSETSIELAKSCFRNETEELKSRVRFILGDVANLAFPASFKLAVAGDLIEHLNKDEVARLLDGVAGHLEADGVFVIHTFPNRWYYKKYYPRLLRAAEKLGAFLPAEPRSRYELLMHINEQSAAVLRRNLRKAFRHVVVWVDTPNAPGGNLLRNCNVSDMIKAPDIYALASQSPLDLERAKRLLTQPRLSPSSIGQIHLLVNRLPEKVITGSRFTVWVKLVNDSRELLSSFPPHPINVSYHWFRHGIAEPIIFEGARTNFSYPLAPGKSCEIPAAVTAPPSRGLYRLEMTLVQEGCHWFDSAGGSTASIDISVV